MEEVFRFKRWFLNAPGLIHGGAYYRNFTVCCISTMFSKRAVNVLGVLMRLRNFIPTSTKLTLFKAVILPHLTYCHLFWHFCRESDNKKLERIQERALRAVHCEKSSSYGDLLEMANLCTLKSRRIPARHRHSYVQS